MNCNICDRPAPGDVEEMTEAGWIPSNYSGRQQMPDPVCQEYCTKHLRIGKRRRLGDGGAASGRTSLELTAASRNVSSRWTWLSAGNRGDGGINTHLQEVKARPQPA